MGTASGKGKPEIKFRIYWKIIKYHGIYIRLNISKNGIWQQFYQIWLTRRDKSGDECYFQIALTMIKWLSFQLPVASDLFQEMAWLALAGFQQPPNKSFINQEKIQSLWCHWWINPSFKIQSIDLVFLPLSLWRYSFWVLCIYTIHKNKCRNSNKHILAINPSLD